MVSSYRSDGRFVRPHKGRLVVQQRVGLDDQLVDLGQRHHVVAVEIDLSPEIQELRVVCDDGLDLRFKLVEKAHGLSSDHVSHCGFVAMGFSQDLIALFSGEDVSVYGAISIRMNTAAHIRTELHEQNLTSVVFVDLVKLHFSLLSGQAQTQAAHATRKLCGVNAPVVPLVHDGEDLPQLVEPEDVEQQGVELPFLHPIVAIAIYQNGLLVRTHQGWLVIQPIGPRTTANHLHYHLVDLS
mmetsp:Transcript_52992/g.85810  ORF Transcript_52992/g.85810 Transcript_52992/m.85810 type:complete len:240 (+) Transcript_52992:808-1527(+)